MISSHKKQRAGSVFCVLLLLISLSLSGCQKKDEDGKWLYTEKQLSAVEALYGQELPEVLAEFQLKESDVSESAMPGAWDMPESVSIEGKEFSETLHFDVSNGTFYGVMFTNLFKDMEDLPGYIDGVMKKITEVYGEPTTYPGIQNRLTSEDFPSDVLDSMKNGDLSHWREDWDVGEKTICTLTVSVVEMNTARITYECRMRNPRVGWQNTD